jgi:hypothetical protein
MDKSLRTPTPLEGAALYAGGAYLLGRDVLCIGFVYHLLPVLIVGAGLTIYCVYRVFWCLHKQVTE